MYATVERGCHYDEKGTGKGVSRSFDRGDTAGAQRCSLTTTRVTSETEQLVSYVDDCVGNRIDASRRFRERWTDHGPAS